MQSQVFFPTKISGLTHHSQTDATGFTKRRERERCFYLPIIHHPPAPGYLCKSQNTHTYEPEGHDWRKVTDSYTAGILLGT